MAEEIGKVVIPGDVLQNLGSIDKTTKVTIGPGLMRDGPDISVTKCGILRRRDPNVLWVDCHQKRVE